MKQTTDTATVKRTTVILDPGTDAAIEHLAYERWNCSKAEALKRAAVLVIHHLGPEEDRLLSIAQRVAPGRVTGSELLSHIVRPMLNDACLAECAAAEAEEGAIAASTKLREIVSRLLVGFIETAGGDPGDANKRGAQYAGATVPAAAPN